MGGAFYRFGGRCNRLRIKPAGLIILTRPEISTHFRYSSFDNEIPLAVAPLTGTFSDSSFNPSFASVVVPWSHIAISTYYDEALHFRSHSKLDFVSQEEDAYLEEHYNNKLDYSLKHLGFTLAFKAGDFSTSEHPRGRPW